MTSDRDLLSKFSQEASSMLAGVMTTQPGRRWAQLENMADAGDSSAAGILGIKALERAEGAGPLSQWLGADTSNFIQAFENLRRYEESHGQIDISNHLERAREALPEEIRNGIEGRVAQWAQEHGAPSAPAVAPETEPETTPEITPEITIEPPVMAHTGGLDGTANDGQEETLAAEEPPAFTEEEIAGLEVEGITVLDTLTVSGSPDPDTEYTVQKGDSLSAIARQHYGIERGDFATRAEYEAATQNAVFRIAEANGHMTHPNGKIYDMMEGPNANHIFPGQTLLLPPQEAAIDPVEPNELKDFWKGVTGGGKIEFSGHTATFNIATGAIPMPSPAPRDPELANIPTPTPAPGYTNDAGL